MADNFENYAPGLESPANRQFIITAGTADIDPRPRGMKCLTAGVAVVQDIYGTQIAYTVSQGEELPFRPAKLLALGTSGQANGASTTATMVGWE